jgi:hypothetical protein
MIHRINRTAADEAAVLIRNAVDKILLKKDKKYISRGAAELAEKKCIQKYDQFNDFDLTLRSLRLCERCLLFQSVPVSSVPVLSKHNSHGGVPCTDRRSGS